MDFETIKNNLNQKGYVVIPNIITQEDVIYTKQLFHSWKENIPCHDKIHYKTDPHGIYKTLEAGHQRHAWYIRTRPQIQEVFKNLWNTEELIVSFDGSCYIPKALQKKDNIWTHTDQAPCDSGLKCYQGFVTLTSNKERTLVVYEGSHLLHQSYFEDRGINHSKNWNLIDPEYLAQIQESKRILEIPAGSLVLWDSRTFHQNQYGKPGSEERLVQYVCYFPKNHSKNTQAMQRKRKKYFDTRRTTSHWPDPISVNGLQPRNFGDSSLSIDYSSLIEPELDDLLPEIQKLL